MGFGHRNFSLFILILSAFISIGSSLYEDQIGKFDWRQQYIGKVSHAFFDKSSSGKKLVVGTENNVIALLNGSSGKLLWRYLLGTSSKLHALWPLEAGKFISVSGSPAVARIWETSGLLNSEFPVSQALSPEFAAWVTKDGVLHSVEITKTNADQYELTVSSFSLSTKSERSKDKVPAVWFKEGLTCEFLYPNVACLDGSSRSISTVNVNSPQDLQVHSLLDLGINYEPSGDSFGVTRNTETSRYLWVRSSGKLYILSLQDSAVRLVKTLENDIAGFDITSVTEDDETTEYLAYLKTVNEGYAIEFYDLASDKSQEKLASLLKLPSSTGKPELVSFYPFRKQQKELGYRYVLAADDHSLTCGNSGDVSWSREESLASIIAVEMVDLPVSETEASIEEEFSSGSGGIFGHVAKRFTSQVSQIVIAARDLIRKLSRGQQQVEENFVVKDSLVRDRFGLHKMIVVVTKPGKIFGMETVSGRIVWRQLLKGVSLERSALYVQRTTAHFPLEPQCAVLATDPETKNSLLFVFHPISGEPINNNGYVHLGFKVQQAITLPQNEATDYLRPLLLLDDSDKAHIYPDSPAIRRYVESFDKSLFMYTADRRSCLMRGFSVGGSNLEVVPIWQMKLCSGVGPETREEITAVVSRKADEKVFSQGRVLADRSVLYKYLNPNLVVVVVEGWSPSQKGYVNVYLLDVVSGAVVFSTVHRRVSGPVHVAHAENWIVYSYYNEKFRRTEMASLELFEGKEQSNSTSFSSFSAPQPMINRQAYIYPAYITAMTDTFTEKGMASKHLLVAIANGWIQELPRVILDPRRPVVATATQEMREEGIIPYVPELPIPAEAIINYNQTVAYVRAIHSTPSALESTSLVLAYGLDLFFTRVTPSKTFDVLKDDFEYFFIGTVVLGLFIASYIAKRMASKKSLKQAWK